MECISSGWTTIGSDILTFSVQHKYVNICILCYQMKNVPVKLCIKLRPNFLRALCLLLVVEVVENINS